MQALLTLSPVILSIFKDRLTLYYGRDDSMQTDTETMSRLKFIGKLQSGEKINVKYMYVQPECIITSISRSLINQDNRHNTLKFVRETVNKAFDILQKYSESHRDSDQKITENLVADLRQSKEGILQLKQTYTSDIKFCCDMDTILQTIDAKLAETHTPPPSTKKKHTQVRTFQ